MNRTHLTCKTIVCSPCIYIGENNGCSVKRNDRRVTRECRKISRHKIPRFIEFTDQFPMTASGKIQKFKLREQSTQVVGNK